MTTTHRRLLSQLCFFVALAAFAAWVLDTCSPYKAVQIGPEPGGTHVGQ